MIDKIKFYETLDEFEAKHIITNIILLGKDGAVRRVIVGEF